MKVYDGSEGQESTPERIKVGIAEYDVSTNGATLSTSGLGSCIGVALHDEESSVSGLVHVMLPAAEEVDGGNPAKFADTGVETLVEELEAHGADRSTMEAKIAGGSDMLDFSKNGSGIGLRNANVVEETLSALDIPIVGEDVGGDHGRSIKLEGDTGDLIVTSANRESKRL
ncbi:Chemoreceptor glutamine deamidase CheD protein [Halorhabdus tiamatea SARL4B]|uniref:Probable chemoreceptor glutamine deamidase CheD n=1 Tax=Halorhabdus tiamatea SARL4B TaxID=1033806 RepID=F7PIY1_9EURY|nr:chemotaxis protein CheD [Halorhabdus tiamatea]ERJ05918.1 Chemoreceptor glutamine deamidase CheD protein [Halorhabdus tiamatea SARL4B]CCQ32947.1 chemotaxis protein CheD--chemoreceptor glutamine deaminase [Halorhabdus tiamatea SARL4B]